MRTHQRHPHYLFFWFFCRTLNRRLKKFSVGRPEDDHHYGGGGGGGGGDGHSDDDAGLLRSPTAASRVDTAASAVKNGYVEETSYDEIAALAPIRLNAQSHMDVPPRVPQPPPDEALMLKLFSPASHRDVKRGVKPISGPDPVRGRCLRLLLLPWSGGWARRGEGANDVCIFGPHTTLCSLRNAEMQSNCAAAELPRVERTNDH